MSRPYIPLIPKRQPDLVNGGRDYAVYAGRLVVGRIYDFRRHGRDDWFWGLNRISTGDEIGEWYGTAEGFAGAKAAMRAAFDRWLAWADEPVADPMRAEARQEIAKI
jgi:hypothetical protein